MEISTDIKRRRDSGDSNRGEESFVNHIQQRSTKYTISTPAPGTKKKSISTPALSTIMPHQPSPSTSQQSNTDPPLSITLSISPLSTPRLFSWSHSEIRELTPPSSSCVTITRKRTKSAVNEVRQVFNVFVFLFFSLTDFNHPTSTINLKKETTLNQLISFTKISHEDITNPYLFKGAPMVTTFVLSASTRTRELWRFIEEASRTDIRLTELEHALLNKMLH